MSISTVRPVQTVPFSVLRASSQNMRCGKKIDTTFVESIYNNGVIQPLLVYKNDDVYEVSAGRRRLLALQTLVKDQRINQDHPVPVIVSTNREELRSLSLVENLHRQQPHECEIYTAIKDLTKDGLTKTTICEKLRLLPTTYDQVLRLSNLHSKIFRAFANDQLSLAQVQAFAASDSKKQQHLVWAEAGYSLNINPNAIRRALQGDLTTTSPIFTFVGLQAYKDAGGKITEDLFGSTHQVHDAKILYKLANNKLDLLQKEFTDSQPDWSWCTVVGPDSQESEIDISNRYSPKYKTRTPEQKLQIAEIQKQMKSLEEQDPEGDDGEINDKWMELEEQLHLAEQMIDVSNTYYLKREMKTSGVIISIGNNGMPEYRRGLQTREDVSACKKAEKSKSNSNIVTSSDYSQALRSDIELYKRSSLKCELTKYPDLAIELLNYSLIINILSPALHFDRFNDLRIDSTNDETSKDDYEASKMHLIMEQAYKKLSLDWLNHDNPTERIEGYISLTASRKKAILSYISALSLNTDIESFIQTETGVDYRNYWTPDTSNYFSRCPKEKLLSYLEEITEESPDTETTNSTRKMLAEKLSALFSGKKNNKSWIPPLFRYLGAKAAL